MSFPPTKETNRSQMHSIQQKRCRKASMMRPILSLMILVSASCGNRHMAAVAFGTLPVIQPPRYNDNNAVDHTCTGWRRRPCLLHPSESLRLWMDPSDASDDESFEAGITVSANKHNAEQVLRNSMSLHGLATCQDELLRHLDQANLLDLSTLFLLVKNFEHRPEVVSSFFIADFGMPPLVAHRLRVVVMEIFFGTDNKVLPELPLEEIKEERNIWEAEIGSFSVSASPSGADINHEGTERANGIQEVKEETDNLVTHFSGYEKTHVNERAAQRHRQSKQGAKGKNEQGEDADNQVASYEYGLPNDYESIYPKLASELAAYYKFMTEPTTQSQEDPIRPATATVYLRHAKLFLGWYVNTHQQQQQQQPADTSVNNNTSLSIYDIIPNKEKHSAQTLIDFVLWLRNTRQISVAYEANLLRGLIKFLKFRFARESETDSSYGGITFSDIPILKEVRKLHRTANQQQRVAPKSSDEQKKWLSWPEYLQVIQKQKEELLQAIQEFRQLEKSQLRYRKTDTERQYSLEEEEIAATFQKYLILAIFASIPDRQRTIRELELGRTLIQDQGCYVIKHSPQDYKTGKAYGERPPLQLAQELTPALNEFIENWRPALRPSTNVLFVQARTGKPMTGDSVFERVTRACFKYTGKRTNPHLLRSMIITHVREESNASEKELEALALFMGHSIQMQRSSYDKRTLTKKIAPAVELLQSVNTKSSGSLKPYY